MKLVSQWVGIPVVVSFLLSYVVADLIPCNATTSCPEKYPCCSQYGLCGTGGFCLGGCDVRYSYNLTACMPMPRMSSFNTVFDSKDGLVDQSEYLGNSSEADWAYSGSVDINDGALLLQMPKNSGGSVISSTKYLWYGNVAATLETSHLGGVVTAFILFSDIQDEIDYEFVGYNTTEIQTNFYHMGVTNYTNSRNYSVLDTFLNYHTYEIDWTPDKIEWIVDGESKRTLLRADTWNETSKTYMYPQTPSRIQMSLWPGGDKSNAPGTIEWAGGAIDWDAEDIKKYGYYYASLKNITIETYDKYIPKNITTKDGTGKPEDFHAFLYNSTKGGEGSVYLTQKKTWLGSLDASGFDPQNNKNKTQSSSSISKSGSSSTTNGNNNPTGVPKGSAGGNGDNNDNGNNGGNQADTTTIEYNTSGWVGGFVQNSKPTASGPGESSSSPTKNEGVSFAQQTGIFGVICSVALGIVTFLI